MVGSSHWREISASHARRPLDPELQARMRWHGQLRPTRSCGDETHCGARRRPNSSAYASADHPSDRCANASPNESSLTSSGSG